MYVPNQLRPYPRVCTLFVDFLAVSRYVFLRGSVQSYFNLKGQPSLRVSQQHLIKALTAVAALTVVSSKKTHTNTHTSFLVLISLAFSRPSISSSSLSNHVTCCYQTVNGSDFATQQSKKTLLQLVTRPLQNESVHDSCSQLTSQYSLSKQQLWICCEQ